MQRDFITHQPLNMAQGAATELQPPRLREKREDLTLSYVLRDWRIERVQLNPQVEIMLAVCHWSAEVPDPVGGN
jgi:hypothetical protein